MEYNLADLVDVEARRVRRDSQAVTALWEAIEQTCPAIGELIADVIFNKHVLRIFVRSSSAMYEVDRELRGGLRGAIFAATKQTVQRIRIHLK